MVAPSSNSLSASRELRFSLPKDKRNQLGPLADEVLENLKKRDDKSLQSLYRSPFLATKTPPANLWGIIDLVCALSVTRFTSSILVHLTDLVEWRRHELTVQGPLYLVCSALRQPLQLGNHSRLQAQMEQFVGRTKLPPFLNPLRIHDEPNWIRFAKKLLLLTDTGNYFNQRDFEHAFIEFSNSNNLVYLPELILLLLTRQKLTQPLLPETKKGIIKCLLDKLISSSTVYYLFKVIKEWNKEGLWQGSILLDFLEGNFHLVGALDNYRTALKRLVMDPSEEENDFAQLARICFLDPEGFHEPLEMIDLFEKNIKTHPALLWKCLSLTLFHRDHKRWLKVQKTCLELFLESMFQNKQVKFLESLTEQNRLFEISSRLVAKNLLTSSSAKIWTEKFSTVVDEEQDSQRTALWASTYLSLTIPIAQKYSTPECVNFWLQIQLKDFSVFTPFKSYALYLEQRKPIKMTTDNFLRTVLRTFLFWPQLRLPQPFLNANKFEVDSDSSLDKLCVHAHLWGYHPNTSVLPMVEELFAAPIFRFKDCIVIELLALHVPEVRQYLTQHLHEYIQFIKENFVRLPEEVEDDDLTIIATYPDMIHHFVHTALVLTHYASKTDVQTMALLKREFRELIDEIKKVLPTGATDFLRAIKHLHDACPQLFEDFVIRIDVADIDFQPDEEQEEFTELLQELQLCSVIFTPSDKMM